jgi:hypothetical protein
MSLGSAFFVCFAPLYFYLPYCCVSYGFVWLLIFAHHYRTDFCRSVLNCTYNRHTVVFLTLLNCTVLLCSRSFRTVLNCNFFSAPTLFLFFFTMYNKYINYFFCKFSNCTQQKDTGYSAVLLLYCILL